MDRLILIPVRGRDRVEEILPYLDDIAQPGSKIAFVMHLGTWQFERQFEKLTAIQRDAKRNRHPTAISCPKPAATNHDSKDQVLNLGGDLKDVEVELKFYTGSLRSLVDKLRQQYHLTVMLPPASNRVIRWLYKILSGGSFPQPLVTAPVLLCHLGASVLAPK